MNSFLKPNCISRVEVIRQFDISFREEFLKMPSVCPEEPLVKTFFRKMYKFLSEGWTMSKKNLMAWKFCRLELFAKNFGFREKKWVHQKWNPRAQGFAVRWTLKFAEWNFLDWYFKSAGPFSRVVKTAFNLSPQTFWGKCYFRENLCFCHQKEIWAKNFHTL